MKEFYSALHCAAGALSYAESSTGLYVMGEHYTFVKGLCIAETTGEPHHFWSRGWLWACYENFNQHMRRCGRFSHHRYDRRVLGFRVLCVASLNVPIGKWRCYIDAVPGINHGFEWEAVADRGTKLPQGVAELLFPELAKRFTWEA